MKNKSFIPQLKKGLGLVLSFVLLVSLLIGYFVLKPISISYRERRRLLQIPAPSIQTVLSGQWQSQLENALVDQMPARNLFLDAGSLFQKYGYGFGDDNGIISSQSHLALLQTKLNQESLEYAAGVFDRIWKLYLQDSDCRIYSCFVPDPGYFMQDAYPFYDYDALMNQMKSSMPWAENISILQDLHLSSYYRTDPHWKSEELEDTARTLLNGMDKNLPAGFTAQLEKAEFTGSYGSRTAWYVQQDVIYSVQSPLLENPKVYIENGMNSQEVPLFDSEALNGIDPYAAYAGGSEGLIRIENPDSSTEDSLIIFRDSYASALVPWLSAVYRNITLVDVRLVPVSSIGRYLDFSNQDVLFLYSTLVLNESETLRK